MHGLETIAIIVGWAASGLTLAYSVGRMAKAVEDLGERLSGLDERHAAHCQDDSERFTSVNAQLTAIATAIITGR